MTDQQMERLFAEMRRRGDEYTAKSTRVSQMLEKVETFLGSLPWKVDCTYSVGGNKLRLRKTANGWGLFFSSGGPEVELRGAAIAKKVAAAELIEGIFAAILEKQQEQLAVVDRGLELLEAIPMPDGFGGEEVKDDPV